MDGIRLEALRKYRLWQKKKAEEGLEESRAELDNARKRFSDAETGKDHGLKALEDQPESLAWKELCYAFLACEEQKMTEARQDVCRSEESFLERHHEWMAARGEVEKVDILIQKERKVQGRIESYREERRMEELHSRNPGPVPGKKK